MLLKVITAPTEEPITADDVKEYARIDTATDDTLLAAMIQAAREYGEVLTNRAWVSRTLELVLDAFPDTEIVLPYPPVTSVTSIKYKDSTNVEQTWTSTEYQTETDSDMPARIRLAYGYTWPVVYSEMNVVRVRYVAGYASVDAIPESIKTWLKLRVNSMYAQREAFVAGQTIAPLQRDFVDGLLDPYRIVTV